MQVYVALHDPCKDKKDEDAYFKAPSFYALAAFGCAGMT